MKLKVYSGPAMKENITGEIHSMGFSSLKDAQDAANDLNKEKGKNIFIGYDNSNNNKKNFVIIKADKEIPEQLFE